MIHIIKSSMVKSLLPLYPRAINKGSRGKVLVIGGTKGMFGAAILAANSALRSGAGLVYLAIPSRFLSLVNINNPEIIALPIHWGYKSLLKKNTFESIIIGPGMTLHFLQKFWLKDLLLYLSHFSPGQKIVIDAGALPILKRIWKPLKLDIVITPHLKELSRLIQKPLSKIKKSPQLYAEYASRQFHCTVVLKSHQSVITAKGQSYLNKSGTIALARGGSGDVLSGVIASLQAQGLPGIKASIAGCFIHGVCGQIAAKRNSIDSVLPTDIIKAIPATFKQMKGK